VVKVRQRLGVSERRACQVLGQVRSTQRRTKKVKEDEEALREDVGKLASRFGRYGYRMVTGMLRAEGWRVNHKRVERIWRQEGLTGGAKGTEETAQTGPDLVERWILHPSEALVPAPRMVV
jgi:transposase InsO family protein